MNNSDNFPNNEAGNEFDRPRPSYGQSAESENGTNTPNDSAYGVQYTQRDQYPADSSNPLASSSANTYGSAEGSTQAGAGYTSMNPAPDPQQPNQPYSQHSASETSSQNPFGAYAGNTPNNYDSLNNGKPVKKKKLGMILTIIGILTLLLALILGIGGTVYGSGKFFDDLRDSTEPNGTFEGNTSEYTLTSDKDGGMIVFFPAADTDAYCSAVYEDGSALETLSAPGDEEFVVDGTTYTASDNLWMIETNKTATFSCENVSAPIIVMGPIGLDSFFIIFGSVIAGLLLGLLGFAILIAGIITWIVQAKRYRNAVGY